ncbi:hypothetical protein SAMN05444000_108120 [Shimia gijangensis]|uniref:Protease inhibitor Inh n=1 Tax=Shimia gijangensis TaxID=1470563 RepID=A0A1M6J6D5_9RHOB|nr:hypothetical protein [Shimia gijangensis]SHJ42258.1 hypothetical protein SAMN05444000_108120 [Shimia gijangensis]
MTRLTALVVTVSLAAPVLAESQREAEDQTPTGKFLTATEVRPILGATKGNWIAVREFGEKDLLYFTHLLAWRCGLYEINFAVNGGEKQAFPMAECNPDSPNAIPDGATIYLQYPLNSIETIDVDLLYDDLATQSERFERKNVMTP